MNHAERQLRELRTKYTDATLENNVVSASIKLFGGYSAKTVKIHFQLLPCYPFCNPIHFWTKESLRLENGVIPKHAWETNKGLEFFWRPSRWNPNRDTLTTYLHVIEQRFRTKE